MNTAALAPELGRLTLAELGDAYNAGRLSFADLARECDRRDRAGRAACARADIAAAWYDAAFAQYLAAEQATCGYLLSRAGEAAGITDAFALWRGPAHVAERYASEELRLFFETWPRLTIGEYRRQLAAERRGERETYRAERAAEVSARPREVITLTRPRPVARPALDIRPPRVAEPARLAIPAAPVIPPMQPGAVARYAHALTTYAEAADSLAARMLAAHDSIRRRQS